MAATTTLTHAEAGRLWPVEHPTTRSEQSASSPQATRHRHVHELSLAAWVGSARDHKSSDARNAPGGQRRMGPHGGRLTKLLL